MQLSARKGNTLAEYGFVAVLVVGLSFAGLSALGVSLNSVASGLKSDIGKNVGASSAAAKLMVSKTGRGTATIKMKDGSSLLVPNYPVNLQTSVYTAGANGTSDLLANTYKSLGRQLLEEGKITEETANMLTDLSNRGHDLARLYRAIESVADKTSSPDAYLNTKVNYNGKLMTIKELSDRTGIGGTGVDATLLRADDKSINGEVRADDKTSRPELQAFVNLYSKVMANSELRDPALQQVIKASSYDILALGEILQNKAWHVELEKSKESINSVRNLDASVGGHQDSGQICDAGDGIDSGVVCHD